MAERSGASLQPGLCPRCQSPSLNDSEGLCAGCVGAVEYTFSRSSPPEEKPPLVPPWTPPIRRKIAIGLIWILCVNIVLASMPPALRSFFDEWPAILTFVIFGSGVLAAGLAGIGKLELNPEEQQSSISSQEQASASVQAVVDAIKEQAE